MLICLSLFGLDQYSSSIIMINWDITDLIKNKLNNKFNNPLTHKLNNKLNNNP